MAFVTSLLEGKGRNLKVGGGGWVGGKGRKKRKRKRKKEGNE
jgi:hypothetical protein